MTLTASRNVASHHETKALSSWFARFKSKQPLKKEPEVAPSIFNVPLSKSIAYANVAISFFDGDGQSFIYGYIPIVVAKCGLYLKENATETEGIFRLSGSAKRIKDLQVIFDEPPKYGKSLDWEGFTVHDAANILRRYLNHLPEPIIPYEYYDTFREPLKHNWPKESVISRMQELVSSLPPLNRQLLLYILDLLAVFASKSHVNRMNSENLSAIFQPGLLTHPRDDMAPEEYRLSQEVLVFLVDNQSHFLLDMCPPAQVNDPAVTTVVASPASEPESAAAATQGVTRRRTLHSPKDAPHASRASIATGQTSPSAGKSISGATVSRANTLPSRRKTPEAMQTPRHVSTPVHTSAQDLTSTPAMLGSTINENSSTDSSELHDAAASPPAQPQTSSLTVSSNRSAEGSSFPVTPIDESQAITSQPNTDVADRQIRAREIKSSSSPSKFGNFFKKKRNQRESISSSTSEAQVRRDLDK